MEREEYFLPGKDIDLACGIKLSHVIRSEIAKKNGIKNDLPGCFVNNAIYTIRTVVYPVKKRFGGKISSFYRNEEVNRLVGGKKNSKHLQALAVDLLFSSTTKAIEVENWCKNNIQNLVYCYHENNYVHVGLEDENNKEKK